MVSTPRSAVTLVKFALVFCVLSGFNAGALEVHEAVARETVRNGNSPDPVRTSMIPRLKPSSHQAEEALIPAITDTSGGTLSSSEDSLFADYTRYVAARRDEVDFQTYVLQPNETVAELIDRVGFAPTGDLQTALGELSLDLEAETAIELARSPTEHGELGKLRIFPEAGVEVVAWRTDEGWQTRRTILPVVTSQVVAASVMTDSLFASGARAGVPREIMVRLANMFLYDVDFVRDIRVGDRFEVVYETRHDEYGRSLGTGDIIFAAMTWRGGREQKGYYRFARAEGTDAEYFDETGASARRLLMKTPIDGARVTSRFGPRRHPTLGYTRAHKGVDFGARTGTPIMAAGDGTVVRADRFGSYGNFLLIRHTGGFETAYAHLSRFGQGVRKGTRVKQGEVVAYVGSTGRSTGPHLHYEVRRAGRHVNPMDLDVATGTILEGEALTAFERTRDSVDALRSRPFAVASGD